MLETGGDGGGFEDPYNELLQVGGKKFKALDFSTSDDSVLSCLSKVQQRKEHQTNSMLKRAGYGRVDLGTEEESYLSRHGIGRDGHGPDVVCDSESDSGALNTADDRSAAETTSVSMLDSSCETWLNLRKFSFNEPSLKVARQKQAHRMTDFKPNPRSDF